MNSALQVAWPDGYDERNFTSLQQLVIFLQTGKCITLTATVPIKKGQEIFVDDFAMHL